MEAYDKAQEMILAGASRDALDLHDEVEMYLIKTYPDLNAQGLVPTILRRAYKDLTRL